MTGDPEGATDGAAVLSKPFTTEDLLTTLARFLPGMRRREATVRTP